MRQSCLWVQFLGISIDLNMHAIFYLDFKFENLAFIVLIERLDVPQTDLGFGIRSGQLL